MTDNQLDALFEILMNGVHHHDWKAKRIGPLGILIRQSTAQMWQRDSAADKWTSIK